MKNTALKELYQFKIELYFTYLCFYGMMSLQFLRDKINLYKKSRRK